MSRLLASLSSPTAATPSKADIWLRRNIGRFGPILLHKSVLQVIRGVLGFLGRAGTMILRQAAAELTRLNS